MMKNVQGQMNLKQQLVFRIYICASVVDAKKSGVEQASCNFCQMSFPACSNICSSAHNLGSPVLGVNKAFIRD
jgi:hypothetical protein